MHIRRISIENYKSFREQQQLHFEPGFNLLVGSNNAGKTTVLDVIDMEINLNEPHRSQKTIPTFGAVAPGASRFEVEFHSTISELRALVASPVYVPLNLPPHAFPGELPKVREYFHHNRHFDAICRWQAGNSSLRLQNSEMIGGDASRQGGEAVLAAAIQNAADGSQQIDVSRYGGVQPTIAAYADAYRQRIYRFSAQRRPGTEIGAQGSSILDREATTLPYWINHLQTNDAHGHRVLCEWMHRIFPNVSWVQAPPQGGSFQIRCLPLPPEARRDDLATPMAKMGAGIGNVLAMLYVVLTSRHAQVIAIDEPNAFLHPRALRELLAILQSEGRQHQFILTAHSADVLTSLDLKTISLLQLEGVETRAVQVGVREIHEIRGGLADLGIRMTDLHAKDRVLWVEGQTEELVIPDVLRCACPEVAAGTAVLRVESTGAFGKKGVDPVEVSHLYERMSTSSALVPPLVCILLDGEKRKPAERERIEKEARGKLRFLDRRMLENYFLSPPAIAHVLKELGVTATAAEVGETLERALGVGLATDLSDVDGAEALARVFSELSGAREEFRKTRDAPVLAAFIRETQPDFLAPLDACLRSVMNLTS